VELAGDELNVAIGKKKGIMAAGEEELAGQSSTGSERRPRRPRHNMTAGWMAGMAAAGTVMGMPEGERLKGEDRMGEDEL